MIELTNSSGEIIFINPKHIVSIVESVRTKGITKRQANTRVFMVDQSHFDVMEHPGAVVAKTL